MFVGLFYSDEIALFGMTDEDTPTQDLVAFIGSLIPSYKDLMALVGM